jgi:hypothetical protein
MRFNQWIYQQPITLRTYEHEKAGAKLDLCPADPTKSWNPDKIRIPSQRHKGNISNSKNLIYKNQGSYKLNPIFIPVTKLINHTILMKQYDNLLTLKSPNTKSFVKSTS